MAKKEDKNLQEEQVNAPKEVTNDSGFTKAQEEVINNLPNAHVKTDEERKREQDNIITPNIDDPADGNKRPQDLNRTDGGGSVDDYAPGMPATGASKQNELANQAQNDDVVRAQSDRFDENGKPVKK